MTGNPSRTGSLGGLGPEYIAQSLKSCGTYRKMVMQRLENKMSKSKQNTNICLQTKLILSVSPKREQVTKKHQQIGYQT